MHDLNGVAHRRQGISEFVGPRGQKFVLAPVGFAQRIFGLFALGDVDHVRHESADPPCRIEIRGVRGLNPVHAAFGVGHRRFEIDPLSRQSPLDIRSEGLPRAAAVDIRDMTPIQLLAAITEPLLVGFVDTAVSTVGIDIGHQGRGIVHGHVQGVTRFSASPIASPFFAKPFGPSKSPKGANCGDE
jgi:hypothetical protein